MRNLPENHSQRGDYLFEQKENQSSLLQNTRLYMEDALPKQILWIARKHWKIESLHWLLDVIFSEDTCQVLEENAHKTLNALYKYELVVHKQFLSATGKKHLLKPICWPVCLITVYYFKFSKVHETCVILTPDLVG